MDSNGCDTNHLDGDVRLPPRKRLLAGLKKQSCLESSSQGSQENSPSPNSLSPDSILPIVQSPLSEFDVRLNNLLKSYKNGSRMSPEEIAAAAKSAASLAAMAAEAARVIAEEKAAIAAKAVASAKSALDMVALASEETSFRSKGKHHKRNKLKKHVPVELLYNKYHPIENCGEDEELARRLHRTMNSSPRISKHTPKKLKISLPNDKNGAECSGSAKGGMPNEGSNEKVLKSSKDDELEVDYAEEAESRHLRDKKIVVDDLCVNGRKRGRIKLKKLPLNVLSSKVQANPREKSVLTNSLITRARTDKLTTSQFALLSMEPSGDNVTPIGVAPTWKCQDFKVSQCIKQDKLVPS